MSHPTKILTRTRSDAHPPSQVTTGAGLVAYRELDEALRLTETDAEIEGREPLC